MALDRVAELARRFRPGALLRPAALILGVGTFLAILGPFGSDAIGWPAVWFYWVGLIALGGVFGFSAGEIAPRLLPNAPEWVIYAVIPAFVAIPVTLAILHMEKSLGADLTVGRVAVMYGPVFVVSVFVSAVAYAVTKLSERGAGVDAAPAGPARALTDKLPHRLRAAPILALTSEDHYLRVRTANGEALILMRLSDAVAAMEAVEGARTHRSWWVARAAVRDARKGDGRGVLILTDGAEAPVSRTYYPALREAGWF
ncbi:MAG: LytTR family DNA-binding domain-containing protein [Oceanicaulis sp.]